MLEYVLPGFFVAEPVAEPAGPGFEITDGCVGIDARDAVGVSRGPAVNEQPASADAFECGAFGEAVGCCKRVVEGVLVIECGVGPEHVVRVHKRDVKAALQEDQIRLGMKAGEARAPDPGVAGRGVFGRDDVAGPTIDFKVVLVKAFPFRWLAGERGGKIC